MKPLETLGKYQEKYPLLIVAIMLTLTLFFASFALNLKTDASFDSMYPTDSQTTTLKNLVSNEFSSTDTLFLLLKVDESVQNENKVEDIRDPRVIQALDEVTKAMQKEPTVTQIFSARTNLQTLPTTLKESKEALKGNQLISQEYTATQLIISVDIPNKPGSIEQVEGALNERLSSIGMPTGVKATLTGQPTLLYRIMNLLIRDNLITVAISLLFIFLILWYYFKTTRLAAIGVVPVVMTLIWLAGTLVMLDIRITMMTAAVGAMMVGMSVDYSIHFVHGYVERVKSGKKHNTRQTLVMVGGALFASALTTFAGFAAMLFGISPSGQLQGLVLGIGIIYAFLTTVFTLPALLVLWNRYAHSPLQKLTFKLKKEKKKESLVEKLLEKLAHFQYHNPKKIIAGVLIFTVLIIPGMGFVGFDTDNANWVPENDEVLESLNDIQATFGGIEQMNLLVILDKPLTIKDLRDKSILKKVSQLDATLEQLPYINTVQSPTDLLKQRYGRIPQDQAVINQALKENRLYNEDYSIIKLTITSDAFGEEDEQNANFYEILSEVETVKFPSEVRVAPQGGIATFIELQGILGADVGKTTLIGFIFVILIASLLYRSFTAGMLAFIPIIFSIIWAVALMGWIGLPFTVLTSGMLAIVMGVGIDFSIHLIHTTTQLRKQKGIEESVSEALKGTGEAILIATLTTVVGFMSLTLASLLVTQRLGYTLALAICTSAAACLLIVPAVLVIREKRKEAKK